MTDSRFALIHFRRGAVQYEFNPGFPSGNISASVVYRHGELKGLGSRIYCFETLLNTKYS